MTAKTMERYSHCGQITSIHVSPAARGAFVSEVSVRTSGLLPYSRSHVMGHRRHLSLLIHYITILYVCLVERQNYGSNSGRSPPKHKPRPKKNTLGQERLLFFFPPCLYQV